jgi:hypothetical protein
VSAQLLFSCVAENRPRFATLAHNLTLSLRSFGGASRDARLVVLFVDAVEDRFRAPLEQLGAQVRVVPRVPGGNPLANKLRMLELADDLDFEVLVALDCDTIVLADPAPWADLDRIGAKAADFDRLNEQEWRKVFASLGISMPERTLMATATGTPVPPYFNSGVVYVPHRLCDPLGRAWTASYRRLSDAVAADPSLIREQWRWLVEQLSLGCAVLEAGLPWHELPPAINFPTHVPVVASSIPGDPVIAHYHSDHDERGFLYRSRTAALDDHLNRFNLRLAEATGEPYAGIGRPPLLRRVRRRSADWFWALLADRGWYRSPRVTALRKRVKRALA